MGERYQDLDLAAQQRIRRVLKISGVWAGFLLLTAGAFIASKPFLDRKREEREKTPGYVPLVTRKTPLPTKDSYSMMSISSSSLITIL